MKLTRSHHSPRLARWRRSSYSGDTGDCVEVALLPSGRIAIRDSKDPAGVVFEVSISDWQSFISWVRESGLSSAPPQR